MNTPDWYALHALDRTPTNAAIETDYPAPLLTRRVFAEMTVRILGLRELAPVRVAIRPDALAGRRRPPM